MSAAEEQFNGGVPPTAFLQSNGRDNELDFEALMRGAQEAVEGGKPASKKSQILALFDEGVRTVAEIVLRLKVRPSYVGEVLRKERGVQYFDLFTSRSDKAAEQNAYSSFFRGVISFGSEEQAEASVTKLTRLLEYFRRLNDHAGQHETQVVALTALNRARAARKHREAEIFYRWLFSEAIPSH